MVAMAGNGIGAVDVIASVDGGEVAMVPKPKRGRRSGGKVSRWTAEEEEKLRALVEELGPSGQWAAISVANSCHFPLIKSGRPPHEAAEWFT